jgi:hypothetical protein
MAKPRWLELGETLPMGTDADFAEATLMTS